MTESSLWMVPKCMVWPGAEARLREKMWERMGRVSGPERRMMPMAPPGGVARAQMVSECVVI